MKNVLLAAVSAVTVSAAFAQSQPANQAGTSLPSDVQVTSPRWNQAQQPANAMNSDSSFAASDQLLAQTVLAIPQAAADAVVAKWTFRKVNHDLNLAADFLMKDFRDSEEYDAAFNAFQSAYDEYEGARSKALANIRGGDQYRAAMSIRKDVSEQIADEHDRKEPSGERLVSLAGLKLDTISPLRYQERDILAADTNVAAARTNLIAAGKKLAKIEKDFTRKARDNSTLADLRKSREEARIAMLASATFLDESRTARDISLRYAYVSRGYDRYVPRLTNSYGYGYGGYRYSGISTPILTPIGTVR